MHYDYIFLFAGKQFSDRFLMSWSNTILYLLKNKKTFWFSTEYNPIVSETRNKLVGLYHTNYEKSSLRPFDGKATCEKVIFIDDDIFWTVDDIEKLLDSDKDIISGGYLTADGKTIAAYTDNNKSRLLYEDIVNQTEPILVQSTGLGFLACKFEVIANIPYPWFNILTYDNGQFVPEDTYFIQKASHYGYKAYLDPTIILNHLKTYPIKLGGGA